MRHSNNLDVLRTCAVMLVFLNHLMCMLRAQHAVIDDGAARFGVILFFVHTSCVLMGSIQSIRAEGDLWVSRFYLRRLFRLYPLSIGLIFVSILLRAPMKPWMGLDHAPYSASTLLSNLLLVQNMTGKTSIIGPLWSLPIEVEMYFVLPLVFLLIRFKSWRRLIMIWLGAALFIAGTQNLAADMLHGAHRFESLEFVPCFLAGAMAFGLARPARPWPSYLWAPSLLALIAIGRHYAFEPLVFWSCCLAVALLYSRIADLPTNLLTRLCHQIANYSYGIYLTHIFGLWIFFQMSGSMLHSVALRITGTVLFTAVASVVLFHLVEDPMIRLGKRLTAGLGASSQPAASPAFASVPGQ